jgi:prevent-host-death family protein
MSEVGIAQLRQDLKHWVSRAQADDEIVITDRGRPVARLTGVARTTALERLVAEGKVAAARSARPDLHAEERVRAAGPVSQCVVEERDARGA